MTDRDLQAQVIRQALQLPLPQPRPIAVAATGVGGDQQLTGIAIGRRSHFLPPAPDALDGELGGVMIDPDTDPTLVPPQVIDPLGDCLAQPLVLEVLGADLLGLAARPPLPSGIAEIPDQFLLLRIHRDDRLTLPLEGGAPAG